MNKMFHNQAFIRGYMSILMLFPKQRGAFLANRFPVNATRAQIDADYAAARLGQNVGMAIFMTGLLLTVLLTWLGVRGFFSIAPYTIALAALVFPHFFRSTRS